MMPSYSEELKSSVIAKMLPPHNRSVPELARETNIPINTLYTWRSRYVTGDDTFTPNSELNSPASAEKFQAVLATATLSEIEIGEYCRQHGYFPEQLAAWRRACEAANGQPVSREEREKLKVLVKENKALQSELQRKEKALAEAAALLILEKKLQTLWSEKEASTRSEYAAK
jgi:hypothetical protein